MVHRHVAAVVGRPSWRTVHVPTGIRTPDGTSPSAWGLNELLGTFQRWRMPAAALSALALSSLAVLTWIQAGTWRDSRTLWQHAVGVTDENHLAYCNLGMAHVREGNLEDAEQCFQAALLIQPDFKEVKHNLANVYTLLAVQHKNDGRNDDALAYLAKALTLEPEDSL